MAIFVTGDVHGGAEYGSSRFSSKSWPDGRTLSRDDVVVVAGDFGFVWDGSNTDRYWLDWFESKPWTTCFVDGNHENHRMLAELPETEWNGGRVHVARPHVLHLMRGEVFDIAGTTVLAMGGAASHDREWRKEGKSWWPEEMPSETEMERCRRNLDAAGWKVDYVVTHEAPADLAGDLCWECNRPFEDDPLQNFLGEIDRRLDFKTWFFGHYHHGVAAIACWRSASDASFPASSATLAFASASCALASASARAARSRSAVSASISSALRDRSISSWAARESTRESGAGAAGASAGWRDGLPGFFRASAMAAAAKSSRKSVFPFRETWFPSPSFSM